VAPPHPGSRLILLNLLNTIEPIRRMQALRGLKAFAERIGLKAVWRR
jgi:hypothetical protein